MNNGLFMDSRQTGYDSLKTLDSFITSKFKKDYDNDNDFYYEDGTNLSKNKIKLNISEYPVLRDYLKHRNDDIKNLGYDYNYEGILTKSISSIFLLEPKRSKIIYKMDKLFIFMVNHIKSIKKTYNFLFDKNYTKFN